MLPWTDSPASNAAMSGPPKLILRATPMIQSEELNIRSRQLIQAAGKHHRAEEQVHIRTKAMEATADGIFIIDALKPDFPFIYANQSCYKMTGYAKEEILGRNYFLDQQAYVDPCDLEKIKLALLHGKSFFGELLQFKKNGEKYWNLLRISPVRDINATVTHYVGVKTDITLLKQRDLEILEKRDELLHVTRVGQLAEFVSSLAHEIKQPLTAILSYAQAGQRMLAKREPQLQEVLGYIIDDDKRATEIIRRLRSLLKKSEVEIKPIDINALIKETVMLLTAGLNIKNNVLKTELESDLPTIQGDRIQLQQVLLNLINNGFDAMEKDQGSHEVLVRSSRKDDKTVMVEVKDSGCGIPEQNKPMLFKHFFTSKPDGLGMGLSISLSIIEAHGGRMDAANNPDRGATFSFMIPASN